MNLPTWLCIPSHVGFLSHTGRPRLSKMVPTSQDIRATWDRGRQRHTSKLWDERDGDVVAVTLEAGLSSVEVQRMAGRWFVVESWESEGARGGQKVDVCQVVRRGFVESAWGSSNKCIRTCEASAAGGWEEEKEPIWVRRSAIACFSRL
ncbi:hypothetical protein BHE74_00012706 [Ensete ventricosum]|nr:hypothetical protein BHE74_00012706 [Ensete ventricosum]